MVAQVDKRYKSKSGSAYLKRLTSYALFEGRPLTTRGRWINPLLFALYGLLKRIPTSKEADAPVFIIGTGRSGTTILGVVMSMHSKIGFLNEPKALWHSINPYEDLIGSYSKEIASYRIKPTDSNRESRQLKRLYGHYLTSICADLVLDKYPELIFRYDYVTTLFPKAKFLFLHRNGWDTCFSIDNWSVRKGNSEGDETRDWWGRNDRKWQLICDELVPEHDDLKNHHEEIAALCNHQHRAAVEWILTMREGLKLLELHSGSVLAVSYENLASYPSGILGDICNFIGLPSEECMLEYAKDVLNPASEKSEFSLPDYLNTPFQETMKKLGYLK